LRRAFVVNAGWPARKDQPFGLHCRDFSGRCVEANDLGIDLAFPDPARNDLSVLRAEIEDENSRVLGELRGLHILRMRLRHTMLRRWVIGRAFHWPKRSLTRNAAPQLLLHFLSGALFDWVRTAAQGQQHDGERNEKGPHLLIL
jgi:hypothetical protein